MRDLDTFVHEPEPMDVETVEPPVRPAPQRNRPGRIRSLASRCAAGFRDAWRDLRAHGKGDVRALWQQIRGGGHLRQTPHDAQLV
jgi:hypothetical protein